MEILFFLVILGIQFAYQIYQAVNKKKLRKSKERLQVNTEEERSEYYSEHSDPSGDLSDSYYQSSSSETDEEFQKEDGGAEKTQARTKNFYEQFFGFIDENQIINTRKTVSPEAQSSESVFPDYVNYDQENLESQDEELFSYDDSVEEATDRTEANLDFITPRTQPSREESRSHIDQDDLSFQEKSSIDSNTNAVSRIRKKIQNPQTFKDNWRIKFILDRPGGLSQNQHFF